MNLREKLRLKWVRFATYMRYQYGKVKDGLFICESCGSYIDMETAIGHINANLDREDMACRDCLSIEDYDEEDEEFPPYDELYVDDEDDIKVD